MQEKLLLKSQSRQVNYTLEGTNLYFQMEKDKKSVDPLKYLE